MIKFAKTRNEFVLQNIKPMIKGIKITISEPCSQDWNNLTIVEQGRFCASCQKVVIDFQKMSDKELFDYFKNYQDNTCGNFSTFQTDRLLLNNLPQPKSHLFSRFLATLLGVFLSFGAKGQTTDSSKIKPLIEISPLSVLKPTTLITQQTDTKCEIKETEQLLQGRVGGVSIQIIENADKSKNLLKNKVFNRVEDILRYF